MSIEVRCEICNRLIRRVELENLDSIQTDEVCPVCDGKIKEFYDSIGRIVSDLRKSSDNLLKEARVELLKKIESLKNETFEENEATIEDDSQTENIEVAETVESCE